MMNNPSQPPSGNNDNNDRTFICGVVEGFYGKPWTCFQRRDLFRRLKELKLNTFMYAPKDDAKHRAKWRQKYTEIEAQQLKELIDEAEANGIDFYYSLSPGLDMVYSDDEDALTICDKYSQLKELGCKCFALLFDDIEPNVTNQKDRQVFNDNYALAQILITNVVYEFLGRPKFLFCPTEYCESRAVPSVPESNYLKMIGSGLLPGIDIMWSGSRVISRYITEESIQELSDVIKRPPVIWENLHANDYDRRRVYLGPYSGRSTRIIPKLRGILTNPNCEYEANHNAIHTLAQWSRCTEDINSHNRCNQAKQLDPLAMAQSDSVYDPERALALAIRDWLPHVLSHRSLPEDWSTRSRSDEAASDQLAKESELLQQQHHQQQEQQLPPSDSDFKDVKEIEDSNSNSADMPVEIQSDPDNSSSGTTSKDNMDTSSPPMLQQLHIGTNTNLVDTNSCESCEMQDATGSEDGSGVGSSSATAVEVSDKFDLDSLALLVDFFYLPFEHGPQGHAFLTDFKWLIDNSCIFFAKTNRGTTNNNNEIDVDSETDGGREQDTGSEKVCTKVDAWMERAQRLDCLCNRLVDISETLLNSCPNKLFIAELRPYLADLRNATILIIEYLKFLRHRKSDLDRFHHPFSCGSKHPEIVSTDDQEPWVHRGGLIGDVHRLICTD